MRHATPTKGIFFAEHSSVILVMASRFFCLVEVKRALNNQQMNKGIFTKKKGIPMFATDEYMQHTRACECVCVCVCVCDMRFRVGP